MIDRYSREKMAGIWSLDSRFAKMLQVEVTVAQVQAQMGIIPIAAARAITKKSKFSVKRILEIEAQTKHDVIAFVTQVAEEVGESGKYLHYGMTSSDVLDTALSLQIQEAGAEILQGIDFLLKVLKALILKTQKFICPGRTHGMFAEPTTFGLKLSGFYAEIQRNKIRIQMALENNRICKLSGAVGTYSGQSPKVEEKVSEKLNLIPETVATQVIPRDRHAELFYSLALYGSGLERLSIELRHLQRSEVAEVTEGFSRGQKGSSAMPHKKNPISSENLTGLSRLLRGYAWAALENVPLWHERDISHSSVERVIFPDAFILTDYMTHRASVLISGLQVHSKKMKQNIELSQGQIFSSQVLNHLVAKGLSREEAYLHVQRLCHSMGFGDHLKKKIQQDSEVKKYFKPQDLQDIFAGQRNQKFIPETIKRTLR